MPTTPTTTMEFESRPYYTETYTIFIEPIQNPSPVARRFDVNRCNKLGNTTVLSAFACGLCAGLVGVTAMGITQTIERHITGRPTSRTPGSTILKLFQRAFFHVPVRHPHASATTVPPSEGEPQNEKGKERMEEGEPEPEDNLAAPLSEEDIDNNDNMRGKSVCAASAAKWGAYFGQGVVFGGLRGVLSYYGVRGAVTDLVFVGMVSSLDCCPFLIEMADNAPL
ncbi:hypothetical protein P691DRAFT_805283, partial [Macrolepiota fuliginosa MF-IS2]